MTLIDKIKTYESNVVFMKGYKDYKQLRREQNKRRMILELSLMPMVLFMLFSSVFVSMLVFAYMGAYILQPLTRLELSDMVNMLLSHPVYMISLLLYVSLIPILVYVVIEYVVVFTLKHCYKRKEIEKEIGENEKHE